MGMDFRQRLCISRIRLLRDSDEVTRIRWYWCAPGAQPHPLMQLWGDQIWNDQDDPETGPYVLTPGSELVGDVVGPKPAGLHYHGDDDWWINGMPSSVLTQPIPAGPTPPCAILPGSGDPQMRMGAAEVAVASVEVRTAPIDTAAAAIAAGQVETAGAEIGGEDLAGSTAGLVLDPTPTDGAVSEDGLALGSRDAIGARLAKDGVTVEPDEGGEEPEPGPDCESAGQLTLDEPVQVAIPDLGYHEWYWESPDSGDYHVAVEVISGNPSPANLVTYEGPCATRTLVSVDPVPACADLIGSAGTRWSVVLGGGTSGGYVYRLTVSAGLCP